MHATLLLAALLGLSGPAGPSDWRIIDINTDSVTAMDVQSIKDGSGGRRIMALWVRTPSPESPEAYSTAEVEINCTTGHGRTTTIATYERDGSTLMEFESDSAGSVAAPGSVGEMLKEAACDGKFGDGEKFLTPAELMAFADVTLAH